jgi:two-component system, NarL family, response regulator LiaR
MAAPIRVLIADDHRIVRKGIRALLARKRDIQVVGEAADGAEAVAQAKALSPDVVLMDLVMPNLDGIQATRAIMEMLPGTRILVLTSFAANDKVLPAIQAGALGYLMKDSDPEQLVQAIRQVFRGEPSLDPSIARQVMDQLSAPGRESQPPEPLTPREMEVLRLVARGRSNKEIAAELMIAQETVHTHVSNILSKLHLSSRTEAALYALREGLASLEEPPSRRES